MFLKKIMNYVKSVKLKVIIIRMWKAKRVGRQTEYQMAKC